MDPRETDEAARSEARPSRRGPPLSEHDQLKKERDLYRGLLQLNLAGDPHVFLRDALELIVGVMGAAQGYLELFAPDDAETPWRYSFGFSEQQASEVRELVSRGIIAEAIASEHVVFTPSALLDPRFRDRDSVQRSRIDIVLCAPIGTDPPCGVVYLQGGAGLSIAEANQWLALFTEHLAPLREQLVLRRQNRAGQELTALRKRLNAHAFVGSSPALTNHLLEIEHLAPLEVAVLISGETGTGKTEIARLIHANSPRKSEPFVEVNCGALPEQLVESELFGAMPGAHSTASRKVEGKVAAARGGTLFFDEIGDLPLSAQAKLLQLLQSKEYYALGASRPSTADVRVIAATHVDLQLAVAERRFREDLFYRLEVMTVRAPSLAERAEDKALLAAHFCEKACRAHKLPRLQLSPGALRAVESAEWPGNIRQLANKIESATIRAARQRAAQVEAHHLFPRETDAPAQGPTRTFQDETRRFQSDLVKRVLEANGWNVSATARDLDLTRAHLYNLINAFGLKR
ncbi:MAG TPA: sigma-54 dependent transcriptional regulator [Polyangiaceae bacterium]|nr:sigma-54 dependent transcriptional regulator [Polyangiaceae bacterium]